MTGPDPRGANARWNRLLDALRTIADDPRETPRRRRIARQALADATRTYGDRSRSIMVVTQGGEHTSGGGIQMATWMREQGHGAGG